MGGSCISDLVRNQIVEACRNLVQAGILSGTEGNVSARFGDGMLITPTGANCRTVREGDLVEIDFDGHSQHPGVPSSEWAMHAEIYREMPIAEAVVHTHADACTALSCLRTPLPAFHYGVAGFGGEDVPCTSYAPFGSALLAKLAAEALRERSACLLANHGMICRGASVGDAVNLTLKLEKLARQFLLASQVSPPVLLDASEMAEARRRYRYYGRERIPSGE